MSTRSGRGKPARPAAAGLQDQDQTTELRAASIHSELEVRLTTGPVEALPTRPISWRQLVRKCPRCVSAYPHPITHMSVWKQAKELVCHH
jgi:hypothetical protein